MAADRGEVCAQNNLWHLLFFHEEEGKRDYIQAVRWLRKAAEQNSDEQISADAENALGVCYEHGYGVDHEGVGPRECHVCTEGPSPQ
jgi:TPR repeat protein